MPATGRLMTLVAMPKYYQRAYHKCKPATRLPGASPWASPFANTIENAFLGDAAGVIGAGLSCINRGALASGYA